MSPWEKRPIPGSLAHTQSASQAPSNLTAGATAPHRNPRIQGMLEREARVEENLAGVDPTSPQHKIMERVLVAARKRRKKLEKGVA